MTRVKFWNMIFPAISKCSYSWNILHHLIRSWTSLKKRRHFTHEIWPFLGFHWTSLIWPDHTRPMLPMYWWYTKSLSCPSQTSPTLTAVSIDFSWATCWRYTISATNAPLATLVFKQRCTFTFWTWRTPARFHTNMPSKLRRWPNHSTRCQPVQVAISPLKTLN